MSDTENVPAPRPGGDPAEPAGPDSAEESLDLLTVSEVAAMLRLSKMTIYRLMDRGSLPALRVGRSFRIPRDSVRALVEESARQA
jgi:excisionase family DNA binding protein